MARAICVRCGYAKSKPWRKCRHCGLDPTQDDEALVRSVYLSTGRYDTEEDQRAYEEELDAVGRAIRSGGSVTYDSAELERLRGQRRAVENYAPWSVVWRLFLPAGLLIGGLLVVYAILRFVR